MSAQQTNLGIVVGVDGSSCSHTAVEWAARDAQMRNVALRVVQVVPPVITAPEGWAFEYSRFQEAQKREIVEHSYLVAQAHQIVEQAHKVALEASSSGRAAQITGEVLHGQIVPTLANISRQVAMVVLGYRGQGSARPRPTAADRLACQADSSGFHLARRQRVVAVCMGARQWRGPA